MTDKEGSVGVHHLSFWHPPNYIIIIIIRGSVWRIGSLALLFILDIHNPMLIVPGQCFIATHPMKGLLEAVLERSPGG